MDISMLFAVIGGVALLLFLILALKIPAFISLLMSSIITGLLCGLSATEVMKTVQNGMGSTLGFVATVVGLGAIFGGILEKSGGAKAIAQYLVSKFGMKHSPSAMLITGFIVAIPVFFDVAFIILIPILYSLQKASGKSLLLYGIPLCAGLAITHTFIPPTPGPIAVADIIGADLGWVILIGFIVGIPTALGSGLIFGKYIGNKIFITAPEFIGEEQTDNLPPIGIIFGIIFIPIGLILINTLSSSGLLNLGSSMNKLFEVIGHPFVALIIANLLAWYILGLKRGFTSQELTRISTKSLGPTGIIILLTGAGGTFKQVLVDSGAGEMIAQGLSDIGMSILLFAFVSAAIIRVVQGSATVAMITSAGLVSPLLWDGLSAIQLAAITTAIAAGSQTFSHVNDSGFWLVKEYLGLTEKQTLMSWSVMTTILAVIGLAGSSVVFMLAG
jgi:Gnt-I system low-affinity gluconate transporter